MLRHVPQEKPVPPKGEESCWRGLRLQCFKLQRYHWLRWVEVQGIETPTFDNFIVSLITMNIVVISAEAWQQPPFPTLADSDALFEAQHTLWNQSLENINVGFTVVFWVEAAIKLMGLGPTQYFSSKMNTFDFVSVCTSLLGLGGDLLLSGGHSVLVSNIVAVIRAARVVRVFRLASRVRGIRRLLETLLYALPSLFNIIMLLALVLFIYTVLGMSFFGHLPFNQGPYQLYNEHANFRYFHTGFFTLFRMSTGESWNGIMHDCMVEIPAAWIFYVTYMVFGSYLMFNLVIAILLEEFSSAAEQDSHLVTPEMIEQYAIAWRDLDPKATHFITCDILPMLLKRIPPPLGAGQDADPAAVIQLLKQLRVKQFKGTAHFVETFIALVLRAYKIQELDGHIYNEIVEQLVESFPSIKTIDQLDGHELIQTFAATRMQAVARGFKARKDLKQRREARRRLGGIGK